ncbi:hypothetical protein C8R43DRAFT_956949 [Mycena crocata]|nr:hypothetical protein C8R43DRAFT_956949 [Mycena crocata]
MWTVVVFLLWLFFLFLNALLTQNIPWLWRTIDCQTDRSPTDRGGCNEIFKSTRDFRVDGRSLELMVTGRLVSNSVEVPEMYNFKLDIRSATTTMELGKKTDARRGGVQRALLLRSNSHNFGGRHCQAGPTRVYIPEGSSSVGPSRPNAGFAPRIAGHSYPKRILIAIRRVVYRSPPQPQPVQSFVPQTPVVKGIRFRFLYAGVAADVRGQGVTYHGQDDIVSSKDQVTAKVLKWEFAFRTALITDGLQRCDAIYSGTGSTLQASALRGAGPTAAKLKALQCPSHRPWFSVSHISIAGWSCYSNFHAPSFKLSTAGSIAGSMAGKRTTSISHRQRFALNAPRDAPIAVHLYGTTPSTPASALADRIFNDPESWGPETRVGLTKEDVAAWDVIDQFPAVPSGPDSAQFSADFMLKPFTNKFRLVRPDIMSPESELESSSSESEHAAYPSRWEGVKEKEGERADDVVPFITLNLESLQPAKVRDKVTPLDRMSILWAHGNLFRAFPSPSTIEGCASAPTSPASAESPLGAGLFQRPLSASVHPSPPMSSPRSAFTPHFSPSPLRTASTANATSATWSMLEYYGLSLPETPRTARDASTRRRSRSASHFLRVPSHPDAPPPPPVPSLPSDVTPLKSAPAPAPKATLAPATITKAATQCRIPPTRREGASLPVARGRPAKMVRPLPAIPPVPPLDPPASWRRPRTDPSSMRSSYTKASSSSHIRSLPMPPTPPPKDAPVVPQKDFPLLQPTRPLTIPQRAPPGLPATASRHHAALSLS